MTTNEVRQRYIITLEGRYSRPQLERASLPQLRTAAWAWGLTVDESDWTPPSITARGRTADREHPGKPQVHAHFLTTIQGKQFITFPGLLDLAHQQGLLSLTEEVTHVIDTYVMAQARAEFHDGRVFRGMGDSTPGQRREAGETALAQTGGDQGNGAVP